MTDLVKPTKINRNIIIVGGGTAGWFAALYANKTFPQDQITVVESDDVGILGAGEGSVPELVAFTDFLDIPFSRLVKDADATVKTSIKFTNWKKDGTSYHHPFYTDNQLGLDGCNTIHPNICNTNIGIIVNQHLNEELFNLDLMYAMEGSGKVPFNYVGYAQENDVDPIFNWRSDTSFSAHFNARKLAKTLRKIAESRGIQRVEGLVKEIKSDELGYIKSLTLSNERTLNVDFLFDCTGFARIFIGKHFNSEWVSHKSTVTVDSAIPFFLDIDKKIPPYTESIAMKHGWVWKIPTRERYGCGYVYDSDFISEDQAKLEVENLLGHEVDVPKSFKFSAGYYKTPWVKNCVSIGLSSSFIEPLEATSIWHSILTMKSVFPSIKNNLRVDQKLIDEVNKEFVERSKEILGFIYLHYMTSRSDSDFWTHYTRENSPEILKEILDIWDYRLPTYKDFESNLFLLNSWMVVARGTGTLNKKLVDEMYKSYSLEGMAKPTYQFLKNRRSEEIESFADHSYFLRSLI